MSTVTLPAGTIKRVHVRKDLVCQLAKGADVAVLVVQTSKGPIRGKEVHFTGPVVLTQMKKQLGCGARIYLETRDAITITGVSTL